MKVAGAYLAWVTSLTMKCIAKGFYLVQAAWSSKDDSIVMYHPFYYA